MVEKSALMKHPEARLLIFAKAPVPGKVKTRLSGMLGKRGAANLHSRMVRYMLARANSCNLSPVELWCVTGCQHPFFASCRREFSISTKSQSAGDLGQRMYHAFKVTLNTAPYALLIGADSPELTYSAMEQSFSALRKGKDAVFVPALDGGYVLVGLKKPVKEIFTGISWGGADVMEETRKRLRRQRLDWLELPSCGDIDTPKDLKRLKQKLLF